MMPQVSFVGEAGERPGVRPCPRILDEPLRFLGLDAEDGAVGLTLFTLLHLLGASFWGVIVGLGAAGLLLALKRGQPRASCAIISGAWGCPFGRSRRPQP